MIRKLQKADLNDVAYLWLDTNLKAHNFISAEYWNTNFEFVKEMLPQAEVYVYENDKKICSENITKNDYVVDMTVGNGNDTLFLANISKKVFGFDIQDVAIENTKKLLRENNVYNYELFNISHEKINDVLKEYEKNIKLILFNLGYLPCGDKSITTNHKTTLNAVKNSFSMLSSNGLILIVFYPHPEGKTEAQVVLEYLKKNKLEYTIYKNTPNMNAPYLIVIKNY